MRGVWWACVALTSAWSARSSTPPDSTLIDDIVARMTVAELARSAQVYAPAISRAGLHLPAYSFAQECLAGVGGVAESTAFPHAVTLGASFDAELVRDVARAIGTELQLLFALGRTRSLSCLAPNLNIARDPRWGRSYESFSEDPAVVAALGSAYVRGLQQLPPSRASAGAGKGTRPNTDGAGARAAEEEKDGDDEEAGDDDAPLRVASLPKHLGAYSVECYDPSGAPTAYPACPVYRTRFDAKLHASELHETYLPAWVAAVRGARAAGAMCAYNAVNGVPSCAHEPLLRGALRERWRLPGPVVSDAGAVQKIFWSEADGGHKYARDPTAAAAAALRAGVDLDFGGCYAARLANASALGLVDVRQLRAAVRRALHTRWRLGLLPSRAHALTAAPAPPAPPPPTAAVAVAREQAATALRAALDGAHARLAERAALAGLVLAKHDGRTLPLPRHARAARAAAPAADASAAGAASGADAGEAAPAAAGPFLLVVGPAANDTSFALRRYTGSPSEVRLETAWAALDAEARAAGWAGARLAVGARADPAPPDAELRAAAVRAARGAGAIVLCATAALESESHDRFTLGLPSAQASLLSALAADAPSSVPLVLVVSSGGAVAVDAAHAAERVGAIVLSGAGGQAAGVALARALFATDGAGFDGQLAATVYTEAFGAASNFLEMSARAPPGRGHRFVERQLVLYPLGHGLGYTSFEAAARWRAHPRSALLVVQLAAAESDDHTKFRGNFRRAVRPRGRDASGSAWEASSTLAELDVTVRNAGAAPGSRAAIALLSAAPPPHGAAAAHAWPRQWVGAFARTHRLPPGGTARVRVRLPWSAIAAYDPDLGSSTVRPGAYVVRLATDCKGGEEAAAVAAAACERARNNGTTSTAAAAARRLDAQAMGAHGRGDAAGASGAVSSDEGRKGASGEAASGSARTDGDGFCVLQLCVLAAAPVSQP